MAGDLGVARCAAPTRGKVLATLGSVRLAASLAMGGALGGNAAGSAGDTAATEVLLASDGSIADAGPRRSGASAVSTGAGSSSPAAIASGARVAGGGDGRYSIAGAAAGGVVRGTVTAKLMGSAAGRTSAQPDTRSAATTIVACRNPEPLIGATVQFIAKDAAGSLKSSNHRNARFEREVLVFARFFHRSDFRTADGFSSWDACIRASRVSNDRSLLLASLNVGRPREPSSALRLRR